MGFNPPILQSSDPFKKIDNRAEITRTIYYGEVISIEDVTDGGRIKVRVKGFDDKKLNTDLPWAYPMLPRFFHIYPQVGEVVRIFIENIKHPEKDRFWQGSIISQPHKIGFDSAYTALSTTNYGIIVPNQAPSTFPDAVGVYPLKTDVAVVGKVNTDIILRKNEVHLRAGKHENNNVLKLNTKNPATMSLVFEENIEQECYESRSVIMADKIALISHSGIPQYKAAQLTAEDRKKIFDTGHPIARGDVLIAALDIFRKVIINHIHGYSNLPADKNSLIKDLEKINLNAIIQENIVIN